MAAPTSPVPSADETSLLRNPPWWLLLLLGASGGGGIGTLISRPVYATSTETVTREDVQEVVDASIVKNNEVLLQKIELMIAKERLHAAGLSSPMLSTSAKELAE
jgi:hypothetical protein